MNANRCSHIVLLFATAIFCFGCGTKERTPFELAKFYFSRPDYPKAIEACGTALAQASTETEKADIHVILGRCYIGQGQESKVEGDDAAASKLFEQAIAEFTTALQLDSNHLDALHNRRLAYRLTGQSDKEAEDYSQIRRNDPNYQTAYQNETEDDPILRLRKRNNHYASQEGDPEETDPDKAQPEGTDDVANDQPGIIELDDEEQQEDDPNSNGVAQTNPTASGEKTPGPQISVTDFEPSAPDPTSQFSQWLSQHQMDPSLGRQPRTVLAPTTLPDLGPDVSEDDNEGEAEDTEQSSDERSSGITPPSNWPSSSQWPRLPTQPTSLPTTGIVGPGIHPPATSPHPTVPFTGIGTPTGTTGIGAEPLPNRTSPYANQLPGSSQTLPTTGITGTFSPYRQRSASLGPYRPSIPEGLRQDTARQDSLRQQPGGDSTPRPNPRIPQSLRPNAPKLPTAPRPTLQYQTSPLSQPSVQPPGK